MALRPLMIRQILTTERAHSTAPFFLDNEIQLENITIVAHLISSSSDANPSHIRHQLEDGSGRISASELLSDFHRHPFIDNSNRTGRGFVHRYVRVIGTIDQFSSGPKSIKANFMRECSDPHEPYFHFLECCAVTMVQRTGALPPTRVRGTYRQVQSNAVITEEDTTTQDLSSLSLDEGWDRPHRQSRLASDPLSHLDTLQRGIIQAILNSTPTSGGVSVMVIAQAVGHHARSPMEISDALDFLLDGGYIRCPQDVNHYILTEKFTLPQGQYYVPMD